MAAAGVRRAGARFRGREETGTSDGYYYFLGGGGGGGGDGFSRVLEEAAPAPAEDAPATAGREAAPAAASAASAMAARMTPAVLFVTVVLAVVLLVSGLLHVLRRFFLKTHRASAGGGERQLQLQHLFFPGHEDGAGGSGGGGGLAQAAIDALPEFAYAELSGAAAASAAASGKGKEKAARPFDCAVCLSEFADDDRLRLLPSCGHAFHVACIDVWLRSSATCPLCRTKLSPRHLAAVAAAADAPSAGQDAEEQLRERDQEAPDEAPAASSVVLPVRLGRFTSADDGDAEAEEGTSDSSRIDARRCYSMGSYQYVLADEHLLVSVHMRHGGTASGAGTACVAGTTAGGAAASGGVGAQQQGKKVFARGDSFSVSKIWQWRGSKRLPVSLCADDSLPWAPAAKDPAGAHTRQQRRSDT